MENTEIIEGNCYHETFMRDGYLYLHSSDDPFYLQRFDSAADVDKFIFMMIDARNKCFPSTGEPRFSYTDEMLPMRKYPTSTDDEFLICHLGIVPLTSP